MIPHDFHRMTNLQCDRPLIYLEGESSTQLSIDLLGRRYPSNNICYFNLEANYKPYPQATPDYFAQMDKAFLLYILEVYPFANGGQTMSLRWLALFHDFRQAQEAN